MKRLLWIALFLGILSGVSAQKPSLAKAYNAFFERDFVKAKEMIDLCTADPKLQTRAQTWLYKGNIYFYLANDDYGKKQENSSYQLLYPSSPEESYDAFDKALELNKNAESYEMMTPAEGKAKLYALLLIYGADRLIVHDYQNAKRILEKSIASYEMAPPEHPLNGEIYYYYAYTLEMLGMEDEARLNYEKAIRDSSVNPNVYIRLIEQYKNEDQQNKVLETIKLAKANLPENPNILVAEADYYWNTDRERAKKLLDNLPPSVYSNSDALVNIANIYIKDNNFQKAEELLQKADRLTPNHFVIHYNLGYSYLKLYEQKFKEGNELAVQGNKSQAELVNIQAENYLTQAETYFEKALRSEPEDLSIMEQLKEIYARKKSPKYDDMVKKINEIKK